MNNSSKAVGIRPDLFAFHTSQGPRKNNEDNAASVVAADKKGLMMVVADGMGGAACGEVASSIAVQTLVKTFEADGFTDPQAALLYAIDTAHGRIVDEAFARPEAQGMGTTVVCFVVIPGCLWVANVGDSRAMQFRKNMVRRLTPDHLYVVEALGIPENRGKDHPKGHVLSQALGVSDYVGPTIKSYDIEQGDWVVATSDGVTDVLNEPDIYKLTKASPAQFSKDAVEAAINAGTRDNCTVAAAIVP